jgi:hypothetical protein
MPCGGVDHLAASYVLDFRNRAIGSLSPAMFGVGVARPKSKQARSVADMPELCTIPMTLTAEMGAASQEMPWVGWVGKHPLRKRKCEEQAKRLFPEWIGAAAALFFTGPNTTLRRGASP